MNESGATDAKAASGALLVLACGLAGTLFALFVVGASLSSDRFLTGAAYLAGQIVVAAIVAAPSLFRGPDQTRRLPRACALAIAVPAVLGGVLLVLGFTL